MVLLMTSNALQVVWAVPGGGEQLVVVLAPVSRTVVVLCAFTLLLSHCIYSFS